MLRRWLFGRVERQPIQHASKHYSYGSYASEPHSCEEDQVRFSNCCCSSEPCDPGPCLRTEYLLQV